MFKFLLALALVFSSKNSIACLEFPHAAFESTNALIERTDNIVLAQVISAKAILPLKQYALAMNKHLTDDIYRRLLDIPESIEYSLVTIDVIKGETQQDFTLIGAFFNNPNLLTSFDNHENDEFWKEDENGRNIGRITDVIGCGITPVFDVGGIYLLFLDERSEYHSKGLERIVSVEKDRWLEYVRSKVTP